jgi:hypothetical protein
MAADSGQLSIGVWMGAVVFGVFFLFRLRRLSRDSVQAQTLNLGTLWITPVIYLALVALVIAIQPPRGWDWLWIAAGAALGGALGWWRGKTVEIKVHSVTGALTTRSSPAAALFLVGLIALRYGLRFLLEGQAGTLHLTVQLIGDTLVAVALGLIVMQRVEMTLRAIRLVGRASTAAAAAPEPAVSSLPPASAAPAPAAAAGVVRAGLSRAQLVMLAVAVFVVIVVVGLAMPR